MSNRLARLSLEGREIGGCRLVRRLSGGGMGAVYLAQQHRLGDRAVAIKVIPLHDGMLGPEHEPASSIEQRFVREGKLLGHLTHPHILPVHDAGAEGNLLYLVMQYAPDGSLMDALGGRGPHPLVLPLPLPFALDLLGQVASALQFIHQHGIVHRDVKPSNILVHVESEGPWHLMLADFGIARAADSTAQRSLLSGTLAYMAPEQFRSLYSPASDQYALAVVAYLLLSGHLPYEGATGAQVQDNPRAPDSLRAFNPAMPSAVEQVIFRALARQPEARYPSVSAFMSALRRAAASGTAQARSGVAAPLLPLPLLPPHQREHQQRGAAGAPSLIPSAPSHAQTHDPGVARPGGMSRGRAPGGGMSSAAAATPTDYVAYHAGSADARGDASQNSRKPAIRRNRRAALLLSCLALLLIAIVADLAAHHIGQTASGAKQPPFSSSSGATAVAATATTPTGAPASSGGPAASPTAAIATAGGAQKTPAVSPPIATADPAGTSSPPPNDAQVVTQPAPASVGPGQSYTVTATIVNTGTATWRNGYGLLCDKSHHPQSACAAGAIIPFSGYTVSPGQRMTFAVTLAAPSAPGNYTSMWSLEQNGQAFGAQDVLVGVTVNQATPTPPTVTPTASPSPTPQPTASLSSSAAPYRS